MNLLIGLNLIFGQSRENMSIKQLAACQRESKILLNLREDRQNTSVDCILVMLDSFSCSVY